MLQPKVHLIIGSSAASMGVLTKLRSLAPHDTIICITAQSELPYNTCLLANYLSTGTHPKGLMTKPLSFFEQNTITLHRNTRVTALDTKNKTVTCDTGKTISYDTLFLGIGTTPLQLPGISPELTNVFNFHTLQDTTGIDTFVTTKKPHTALVIGGGLSGVECADALTERGIQATLVESAPHLLPTLITADAADALAARCTDAGTRLITGTRVQSITTHNTIATGATLDTGAHCSADMVVVAIGTRSNATLAEKANIACKDGGIIVDRHMQTSDASIFSGGDVALVPGVADNVWLRSSTWPDAVKHGMIAAHSMAGVASAPYKGLTPVMSSIFYGTQFVSCGPITTPPTGSRVKVRSGDGWHHTFLYSDDVLIGFAMMGNVHSVGTLRAAVASGSTHTPQ
jgi:NAD(P)H-nitrite reductase large subunit